MARYHAHAHADDAKRLSVLLQVATRSNVHSSRTCAHTHVIHSYTLALVNYALAN